MRSKCFWQTDLGLNEMSSGELSPGLDPIELRYYPPFGMGINEWSIDVALIERYNPVEKLEIKSFNNKEKYFTLFITFKQFFNDSQLRLLATHKKTQKQCTIFEGTICPTVFPVITCPISGMSQQWTPREHFKATNLNHFKLPTLDIHIPLESYLIGSQGVAPLDMTGFHPDQEFIITIDGVVIGSGGHGGDAGISIANNGWLDVEDPKPGQKGGNAIKVEHTSQTIEIFVTGVYMAGHGGKGGSSFAINHPKRRYEQVGNPGLGGFPNGVNGQLTNVHLEKSLVRKFISRSVENDGLNLIFHKPILDLRGVSLDHKPGTYIEAADDGKDGSIDPLGNIEITFLNESSECELNAIRLVEGVLEIN